MESETTHLVIEVTADAADTEELAQMTMSSSRSS